MKLTKKGKLLMVAASVLACVMSVYQSIETHFFSQVLAGVEQRSMELIIRALVIYIVIQIPSYAIWVLNALSRERFLGEGCTNARDGMMGNILRRSLRSFRERDDAYYLNLLGADVDLYRNNRLRQLLSIISNTGWVVASLVLLFLLNPWLCLVGLVVSFVPLIGAKVFTKSTQRRRKEVSGTAEQYTSVLKEGIQGYETIRMAGAREPFLLRFHAASRRKEEAQVRSAVVNSISYMVLWMSASVTQIVCLGVGGYLAVKGALTLAMLYAALRYLTDLSNGLSNLMEYVVDFRATRHIVDKLKSEAEAPCPEDGGLEAAGDAALVYDKVSFAFGERQLYDGLSFQFAPGGCYAVLGESGSGKSTLLKLLLKYYDDYAGEIRLCGREVRTLSEDEVYRAVGVVNQSPFLFNATLYENITMFGGSPSEDSEEYRALLRTLNLAALAERVGEQPLGDFGDNISGGERQRINIARALVARPRILIFDEPTTGLDPENVALIDEFIFQYQGATRIVISHNWSNEYLDRFDGVIRIQYPEQAAGH